MNYFRLRLFSSFWDRVGEPAVRGPEKRKVFYGKLREIVKRTREMSIDAKNNQRIQFITNFVKLSV
jgi:hypothetical protein